MESDTFYCSNCKQNKLKPPPGSLGVGYARKNNNHKVCYKCCGVLDEKSMTEAKPGDRLGGFYLTKCYLPEPNPHREYQMFLSNWPGSWKKKVITSEDSRNNWNSKVQHFWFMGKDKHEWYGRLTGESKDLVDFILKTKKKYHFNAEGFCIGVY